jgi:hypothetical protein
MNQWNKPDIPCRGWLCERVYYVQENNPDSYEVCHLCGNDHVKFVFVLSHPEYPEKIKVDSACVEKLMDNYVDPIIREKELLNRHRRRLNWLDMPWRLSKQGNDYMNISGYNITIFEDNHKKGKWGYHIAGGANRKLFDSKDLAKIAVFDMFWQLTHSNQV